MSSRALELEPRPAAVMASWEVVGPHISKSMEQSSRPKVGFHISDIHSADGGGFTRNIKPKNMKIDVIRLLVSFGI